MDIYHNFPNQNINNLNDSFLSRRGNDIINNSYNPSRQDFFYNNNNNNISMQNNINNMQPLAYNNNFNNQMYNPIPFHPTYDNFNQNMNNIVKEKLLSRGVVMSKNQSPINNKNFDINVNDTERKKMLLNNIQQQINMTKNSKMIELEKKRKEDEKYLNDIQNFYPFGRGGAGAPIRDRNGQVQTTRKALISDPKYQHVALNIEDDYEDTNKTSKMYGLVNYNRNIPNNYQNQIPNSVPITQNNQFQNFNNRIPSGRNNYQQLNTGSNYQPVNNYQSPIPIPMYNNYNQPPQTFENNNPQVYYENNNGYNNNPMINEYIPPIQNGQNMPNIHNLQNVQQPLNYSDSSYTNNNPNKIDLQISYKNSEVDDDLKKKEKYNYGNYLREQMEIDRKKKEQEKEQKKKEDYEEELRVKRQLEILRQQEESEKEKKKKELEKLENDNEKLKHNVMSKRKKINYEEEFQNSNNKNNMNNINSDQPYQAYQPYQSNPTYNNIQPQPLPEENIYNHNSYPQQIFQPNDEELEIRKNLNNEILNLRSNMLDQQNTLLKQINDLKIETQNANNQRYEVLKEFNTLKEEISKQRIDEEMRRKYV